MKIKNHVIKSILSSLAVTIMLLSFASVVSAQEAPEFPICSNPQGEVKVAYNSGEHAVPGENSTRTGSDTVYSVGDGNYVQCFCAEDGSGVQTNWWRIPEMDQESIGTFVRLGWNFIPDGSNWGLDETEYLAKNNEYSCGGGPTATPTPNPSATPTPEENNQTSLGGVSDERGLVLAATGNSVQILGLFILGLAFVITGTILRKRSA